MNCLHAWVGIFLSFRPCIASLYVVEIFLLPVFFLQNSQLFTLSSMRANVGFPALVIGGEGLLEEFEDAGAGDGVRVEMKTAMMGECVSHSITRTIVSHSELVFYWRRPTLSLGPSPHAPPWPCSRTW